MMDFKRGISPKDLRPFSVDDPLGQKRRPQSPASWPTASARREFTDGRTVVVTPEQARKWARLGCFLPMILIWAIGILVAVGSSMPELVRAARPMIEMLVAHVKQELGGASDASTPTDTSSSPAASDVPPATDAALSPAPSLDAPAPSDTTGPGSADSPQAELQRVCERTVQCCLTVQGERARSICENFRRMPVVEPCQQAFEAFAQVGRQTGRVCPE